MGGCRLSYHRRSLGQFHHEWCKRDFDLLLEPKAEECVLHPCHGCLAALCCREPFGLDLADRRQLIVTDPGSQPLRATSLHFHPVVLQLLVSHPMVFICCITLLNSVAGSIDVPCLGWLCSAEQGGTALFLSRRGVVTFLAAGRSARVNIPSASTRTHYCSHPAISGGQQGGLTMTAV